MDIDTMPAGPEIDALVGQHIFGHEVLGLVCCTPDMELQHSFYVPYEGPDPHGVLRPVYLAHCVCDVPKEAVELGDADYWGHTAGCLEAEREWSEWIAAAWKVVEKLATGNILISLMDQLGFEDEIRDDTAYLKRDKLWRVQFMDSDAHKRDAPRHEIWFGVAQAETAPLAICRAAIKVVCPRKVYTHEH